MRYYIPFTIDGNQITEDMVNFPIMIRLSSSSGITGVDLTGIFDRMDVESLRIGVTDADLNEMYVGVLRWDTVNQVAILYCKVDAITTATNKPMFLWYDYQEDDNTAYVGVPGSTPGSQVWDGGFEVVVHMNDGTTTAKVLNDVTGLELSKKGAAEPAEATGMVYKAQDYDGSDDYIQCGNGSEFDVNPAVTLEALVKPHLPSDATDYTVLSRADAADLSYALILSRLDASGGTRATFQVSANGTTWGLTCHSPYGTIVADTWYHIVGVFDGGNLLLFINGAKYVGDSGSAYDSSVHLEIGRQTSIGKVFDGQVEEVRFTSDQRSDAWIWATYKTLFDELITFGTEGTVDEDSIRDYLLSNIPDLYKKE